MPDTPSVTDQFHAYEKPDAVPHTDADLPGKGARFVRKLRAPLRARRKTSPVRRETGDWMPPTGPSSFSTLAMVAGIACAVLVGYRLVRRNLPGASPDKEI